MTELISDAVDASFVLHYYIPAVHHAGLVIDALAIILLRWRVHDGPHTLHPY